MRNIFFEKWIGQYSYDKPFADYTKQKTFPFTMELQISDNIVTGKCIDEIAKNNPELEAKIEGSIKNEFIYFTKEYLVNWHTDENSNVILNKRLPTQKITYSGQLFEDEYKGIWEILVKQTDYKGTTFEQEMTGNWSMRKANSQNEI